MTPPFLRGPPFAGATSSENPASPGGPPTHWPRRAGPITRSRRDRVIAGVCGGIGDYFDVDPVLVRVAFVALAFAGGVGVLAYLIALVLVPEESDGTALTARDERRAARTERRRQRSQRLGRDEGRHLGRIIALLILIAIASSVVGLHFRSDVGVALVLVAIGAALLWSRARDGGVPLSSPVLVTDTVGPAGAPPASPPDPSNQSSDPPNSSSPRGRSDGWGVVTILGPVGLSALLLAAGVVAFVGDAPVMGAISLALAGFALVVGAALGHSRGVVTLGLVFALALWAGAALAFPWHGGIGDRTYRPAGAGDLQREYRLGIGDLTVDLRDLQLDANAHIDARVGIGELTIRVPRATRVVVDGHADAGAVEVFGRHDDGLGVDAQRAHRGSTASPTLRIDARVGAGHLQVLAPTTNGSFGG